MTQSRKPPPRTPEPVIAALHGVTKRYDRNQPKMLWRELLGLPIKERTPVTALDDVSVTICKGERVGLIGANGAGKSTILRLVTRVTDPTVGTVITPDDSRALIDVGVGFHPDLDAWHNIRTALIMFGYTPNEARFAAPEVAEFAEIGNAMNLAVKHLSAGMAARLAFAAATHRVSELLAVDEILAVGDRDFQLKCLARLDDLIRQGATLMFVSHELSLVAHTCDRVLLIDRGRIVDDGPAASTIERYLSGDLASRRTPQRSTINITELRLPDFVDNADSFPIEVDIEVNEQMPAMDVVIGFTQPARAADVVIARSQTTIRVEQGCGQFRLSSPSVTFKVSGAYFRCFVAIQNSVTGESLASSSKDIAFGSGTAGLPAQFRGDVSFEIVRHQPMVDTTAPNTEIPESTARADTTSTDPAASKRNRSDQPVLKFDRALKMFTSGRSERVNGRRVRVTALDNITFDIDRGDAVGLIGSNGAGKSTVLKAAAGILGIDAGNVQIDGRVVPILDLSPGFNDQISGVDNIDVMCALYGYSPIETSVAMQSIIDFSGIGDAIHAPIRTYSSGMRARLGFAIAIHCPGDVLLIDELLAVGDDQFRQQALRAVRERCARGAAVLFVSHEMPLVADLCTRCIRLDKGAIVDDGPTEAVIERYVGGAGNRGVFRSSDDFEWVEMNVSPKNVAFGAHLFVDATIRVNNPNPFARLELTYRLAGRHRTHSEREDRYERTVFLHTLVAPRSHLATTGEFTITAEVAGHDFNGTVDVTLGIVDERDQTLLAEAWHEVAIGIPDDEFPKLALPVDWTVTPL